MTKIIITYKNSSIDNITISGHANFAKAGKDIVCSSISTLVFYTINAIKHFDKEAFVKSVVNQKDQTIEFQTIELEAVSQKLLELLLGHLKEISNQYKENIKIEEK